MVALKDKRILVTGASGTIGKELIRQLLTNDSYGPASIIGIDNNESELFFLEQDFLNQDRFSSLYADIRDLARLTEVMKGVDVVFHTAALKHVVICERSPFDSVQTNILGVQNIIRAAIDCSVEKVVFTSSDKAVNPTNVMGTSKLMGERLITAANAMSAKGKTLFSSTRFGNVLGSRGSVLPIFREQIAKGGPITLTHEDISRFIMSIDEAVGLVLSSSEQMRGGEVFVTKMPVVKIADLARAMIEELAPVYGHKPEDIGINIIGTKPGEKLYEELMSDEETRRAKELKDFFVVVPAFSGFYTKIDYTYDDDTGKAVDNPYNSANEPCLTVEEIKAFLAKHDLLEIPKAASGTAKRYWPGDKEAQ